MRNIIFVLMLLSVVLNSAVFAADQRFTILLGDSPQKGPKDAPVTVIEFLDFQ